MGTGVNALSKVSRTSPSLFQNRNFAIMLLVAAVAVVVILLIAMAAVRKKENTEAGRKKTGSASGPVGEKDVSYSWTPKKEKDPDKPVLYKITKPPGSDAADVDRSREAGAWICCYCETINPNGTAQCAACGKRMS